MKEESIKIILIVLVILLMILGIFTYIAFKSEGKKCVEDPINYFTKVVDKQKGLSCICSCSCQDKDFNTFIYNPKKDNLG